MDKGLDGSARPPAEQTWTGFHLNPGGFFQYREVGDDLQIRRPWGDTVTDPKVHNFVRKALIGFAAELRAKAETKNQANEVSAAKPQQDPPAPAEEKGKT